MVLAPNEGSRESGGGREAPLHGATNHKALGLREAVRKSCNTPTRR